MLRNFRSSGSGRDLASYITAKRNFKKICTNKKIDYQKCMRNKLIQERKNPNSFRKIIIIIIKYHIYIALLSYRSTFKSALQN